MVRRQARGERRIAEILDAALALFAEAGYDRTSTNAIAARAGISPGSLYQYFPNKEAIAEALSRRLLEQMREAHATAFDPSEAAALPLPDLLDRVVDPLVAFNVANPGAKVLIGAGTIAGAQPLHQAVSGRVAALVSLKFPGLPEPDVRRTAMVAVQIVAALMPSIVAAAEPERAALVTELKRALLGYLTPPG
ncbi:TetR/AcrR family transcriptional regulator [Actinoplanes sp. CA-015351]|uniref:TetR/AcrR family transcriptional regulator n=1 Tax=Actinoplanes sp. CA-015351 TaxID=3239897 RepID=UPI003D96335D